MAATSRMRLLTTFVIITGLIQGAIAEDNPANFRGMVKVMSTPTQNCRPSGRGSFPRSLSHCTWYAAAVSEDLPDPDFTNRFHLLLMPENPSISELNLDR